MDTFSFGYRFSQSLEEAFVGSTPNPHCPGTKTEPKAAPGYFCIYQQAGGATAGSIILRDLGTGLDTQSGTTGAGIYLTPASQSSSGTWAATQP
jgi:hypothetical protein